MLKNLFFRSNVLSVMFCLFFFFNDTATTEIYTLSLHDALPIWAAKHAGWPKARALRPARARRSDRKSTRLNSSHEWISYAVFCLKKKKHEKIKDNWYKQTTTVDKLRNLWVAS